MQDFVDALYMCTVSVSTVGYGDLSPSSWGAKTFAIFYIPVGVAFVANAIDFISGSITEKRAVELEDFVLGQFGEVGSLSDNKLTPFARHFSIISGDCTSENAEVAPDVCALYSKSPEIMVK